MVFVQIASPSRTRIPRYQALQQEVRETVRTINEALGERGWVPIVYRERHHDHAEIRRYYRAADFCMVTSLHDGMNLVAKEYVAAQRRRRRRADPQPLHRAPPASCATPTWSIPTTWRMWPAPCTRCSPSDASERRSRMARMRTQVREHNIFGWAGLLLAELAKIPQPAIARAATERGRRLQV